MCNVDQKNTHKCGLCVAKIDKGKIVLEFMAGAAGFEPANVDSKNRCLTAWRRPKKLSLYNIYINLVKFLLIMFKVIFYNFRPQ